MCVCVCVCVCVLHMYLGLLIYLYGKPIYNICKHCSGITPRMAPPRARSEEEGRGSGARNKCDIAAIHLAAEIYGPPRNRGRDLDYPLNGPHNNEKSNRRLTR